MVFFALERVCCWVVLHFSVGVEAFDAIDECSLDSEVLWCSQDLDLSLLPLVFNLILTVASRLLHPYSTDDKSSRLVVKRFSTVRNTQRGSQSYTEKRRGRREME